MKNFALLAFFVSTFAHAAPVISCQLTTGDGEAEPLVVQSRAALADGSEATLSYKGRNISLYARRDEDGRVYVSLDNKAAIFSSYNELSYYDVAGQFRVTCNR